MQHPKYHRCIPFLACSTQHATCANLPCIKHPTYHRCIPFLACSTQHTTATMLDSPSSALPLPLQLYNEQLACGVQPSGSTMAMLINTFSAKGMWGDALGLLSAMSRCAATSDATAATSAAAAAAAAAAFGVQATLSEGSWRGSEHNASA